VADYWVEGQVNYRTLMLLGSLSIAGLMWAVYHLFRKAGLPVWMLLPVALLLFQPSYQDDVWSVICLLQHTLTLLLILLVFQLLTRPQTWSQAGALVLGWLIIYSNSNGFFMWVAVLVLLTMTRRWRWLTAWLLTGSVLTYLYFGVNYAFLAQSSLESVIRHPGWVLKSVISFAGSALYFDQRRWLLLPGQWVILGAGTLVLLSIAASWLRGLARTRWLTPTITPFLGLGFVLIATGLAAALVRSDGGLMIIERYQLFAVWCLIVVYALLILQLTQRWRKRVGWVSLGLASWFWLNAWLYYGPQLSERYNRQIAEAVALKHYGYSVVSQPFGRDVNWRNEWNQAMKQGLYKIPDLPEIAGIEAAMKTAPHLDSTIHFATAIKWIPPLSTDGLYLEQDTLLTPDFLYLQSAADWYVMPRQRLVKPVLGPFLPDKGIKSSLLPVMLKPGSYRLGWIRRTKTGWFSTLTRQEIQVKNKPLPLP